MTDRQILENLVKLGNRFRLTPIVDDDFPIIRDEFDSCLAEATKHLRYGWMRPPWRDEGYEGWPWVGDQFLAAVHVHDSQTGELYWEYTVLTWSETGLECDRESWGAWGESDIEWIARISEPSGV